MTASHSPTPMANGQSLTSKDKRVYLHAVELSQKHLKLEKDLVRVLQEIEVSKIHKKLGYSSLFKFACKELNFTEPVAYSLITVARAAKESVPLRKALSDGRISVSRASRIVSVLKPENAESLIEFARTHTLRETDFEVARLNPKAGRERMRVLNEDRVEISVSVSKAGYEVIKRAKDLLSNAGSISLGEALEKIAKEFMERRDPVAKAQRARSRKLCSNRVPRKIDAIHEVNARDEGQCTFKERDGSRCTSRRWLHRHHIQPRARGGADTAENLTTLCAAHHDLVHQLEIPGLLRSRRVEYRAG